MKVLPKVENKPPKLGGDRGLNNRIFDSSAPQPPNLGGSIIRFNHVTIKYGERTILKDLDWTVHQGEHWSLSGQNGSGKSTLLPYSRWFVPTIPRAMPVTSRSLDTSVVPERASGISSAISAMYRQRCIAAINRISLPFRLLPAD